jgi:hypothetical protein
MKLYYQYVYIGKNIVQLALYVHRFPICESKTFLEIYNSTGYVQIFPGLFSKQYSIMTRALTLY